MKKVFKILGITLGVGLVAMIGLGFLGYNMHSKAEGYLTDNGYKNALVIKQTDDVLCKGSAIGMVVAAKKDTEKEDGYFPICVPMFGEASQGIWADGGMK